ncbi:class I SAM-dependent methyltransferase [Cohaesibacter celericrescens]|uniref:class I SAM-dependent methyltransferase n=1 Tax=Cohaesibacter celericrescens TaxID=2067669 RepID=UPI003569D0FB
MTHHPMQAKSQSALSKMDAQSSKRSLQDRVWQALLTRMLSGLKGGALVVSLPSGCHLTFGESGFAPIVISVTSNRLLFKVFSGNPLALAEGNLQGYWSCSDQVALFILLQKNRHILDRALRSDWLTRLMAKYQHKGRSNTRTGSRRNIAFHYDLGNDFYRLWLDETMTYSAAYGLSGTSQDDLVQAQLKKYARVLELLDLDSQSSVLEIGCGWGSMALTAAAAGHKVKGVTLSREQLAFAQDKVIQKGLAEQVDLSLTDYRDVAGVYDGIVSIEMIEAVGQENWPEYFQKIRQSLKPGGRAVIQAITIADDHFDHYRNNVDFIQHYIFPGGFLPSPQGLEEEAAKQGLLIKQQEFFGADYARTLAHWRQAFLSHWPEIEALGFDARFKRMWLYYLDYCEAGFWQGSIDVGFFVIEKPANG